MSALPMLLASGLIAHAEPWEPEGRTPPAPATGPVVGGTSTSRTCFPSGLSVYGERVRTGGVVLVGSVIGAGSADEAAGQEGLAHLVEHLWFRSDHAGAAGLFVQQRAEGLWLNAQTTRDHTTYLVGGPVERVEELLRREGARLAAPLRGLDEAAFAVERAVVQNERLQGHEQDGQVAIDELMAALYPPDHPYAHPLAGTVHSLDSLHLSDAQAFTAAHYRPANASVHVVGEVALGSLGRLVQATFPPELLAGGPGGSTDPVSCPEPSLAAPSAWEPPTPARVDPQVVRAHVSSPVALAAWTLPPGFTATSAMGHSVASIVEFTIYEDLGHDVDCWLWDQRQGSALICALDLEGVMSKRQVAASMVKAGSRVWKDPRYDWDRTYQNMRWILAADFVDQGDQRWSAASGISFQRMAWIHATGEPDYVGSLYGLIATPTLHQAQEYTSAWLRRERGVSVLVLPHDKDPADPADAPPAPSAAPLPPPVAPPAPTVPQGPPTTAELALLAAQPAASLRVSQRLANQLGMVILPGQAGNQVRIELVLPFPSGTRREAVLALASTPRLSTFEGELHGRPFSRAPWYVGGGWIDLTRRGSHAVGVSGANTELEGLMYLVRRRLEQSAMITNLTSSFRGAIREAARQRALNPQVLADRLRWQRLVGDRPRPGDIDQAVAEGVAGVSDMDARRWLYALLQPQHATLVVTGAVSPERVQAAAARWLGDWRPEEAVRLVADSPPPLPAVPERQAHVWDQPGTHQHWIELSCRLDGAASTLSPAQELAGYWLDEHLFRRVRVERGLSYTPAAWVEVAGGTVLLHASILADERSSGQAIGLLLEGLQRLGEGLPPTEVHAAQRALATLRRQELRTAAGLASLAAAEAEGRTTWQEVQDWPARLAEVDGAAVAELMRWCHGHEVITVIGEQAAVQAQLDLAGLSPPPAP